MTGSETDQVPEADTPHPTQPFPSWLPLGFVAAFAGALVLVATRWHQTPLYGVETDFVSEYALAARELLSGNFVAEHYDTKGPGYPVLLSIATWLLHGNEFFAAQLLGIVSAALGAWFSFLLIRRVLGKGPALACLLFLLVNPIYVQAAVEVGTDTPTFALSIAATYLVICGRGRLSAAVAGFITGYAIITRYNALFLIPAAVIAFSRPRHQVRSLALYAVGLAIPVGTWFAIAYSSTGQALGNTNYFNLAYALYGNGVEWDRFWGTSGSRFRSFGEVIAYDPLVAIRRIGANLATHWLRDARELMPTILGAASVAGMILYFHRGRHRLALIAHFAMCYLALTAIFYSPRFFLYLLPFYLAGAGAYVLNLSITAPPGSRWMSQTSSWQWGLVTALCVLSGVQVVRGLQALERNAPIEVHEAGHYLQVRAHRGAAVMARKPHVAYMARLDYVPMPWVSTLVQLIEAGRRNKASYLFFSGLEENAEPQLAMLSVQGAQFPGLHQEIWRVMPRDHSFAIYRFTSEPLDSALLVERVTRALERRLESDPENASLRLVTAGIFMNERLFSPAIRQLAAAERLSPGDPEIAVLQATAYQSAGDTAMCLVACQRATRLGLKTAFQHGEIGLVLYRLRDFAAAINQLSNAVRLEPSHALYLTALGSSHFQVGDYSRAARELERALSIVPAARQTRLQAAQAYALSRQPGRSLALIEAGRRTGVSSPQLDAFADSLRNSESSARVR